MPSENGTTNGGGGGKGRPKGSQNCQTVVQVQASRCPNCQSTRRSEYLDRTVQEFDGTTSSGEPFNLIVRRRTRCLDCEQMRIDKTLEFDPTIAAEPPKSGNRIS